MAAWLVRNALGILVCVAVFVAVPLCNYMRDRCLKPARPPPLLSKNTVKRYDFRCDNRSASYSLDFIFEGDVNETNYTTGRRHEVERMSKMVITKPEADAQYILRGRRGCDTDKKALRKFRKVVSSSEEKSMYDLLFAFVVTMETANLTYFLTGGTLLGSIRHHGLIPWDDDLDVAVMYSERSRLQKALTGLHAINCGIIKQSPRKWKVYFKDGYRQGRYQFKWPFIDLYFVFARGNSLVWYEETQKGMVKVNQESAFPLTMRPFGYVFAKVPREYLTVLRSLYRRFNMDECVSNRYNHREERFAKKLSKTKCRNLWHIHPFVFRQENKNETIESLMLDRRLLQTATFQRPCGRL